MIEKYNLPAPIEGDKEVFWVKESVFRLYHAVFQVTKIALHRPMASSRGFPL